MEKVNIMGPIRGTTSFETFRECTIYDLDSKGCEFFSCEFHYVTFVNCHVSREMFCCCRFYNCVFNGLSCTDQNAKDSVPAMFARSNSIGRSLFYITTEEDAKAFCALFANNAGTCWLTDTNDILDIHGHLSKLIKMQCPEAGSFTGYKKALYTDYLDLELQKFAIIRLAIPEDAKRSSAFGNKCRCSKAEVIDIYDLYTGAQVRQAFSWHDINFNYTVGEEVSVDNFDENRFNECAPGIHFFMTEKEAKEYIL